MSPFVEFAPLSPPKVHSPVVITYEGNSMLVIKVKPLSMYNNNE